MKKHVWLAMVFLGASTLAVFGCGGSSDSGSGSKLLPITDSYSAEWVVEAVASAAEAGAVDKVTTATPSGFVVYGTTGTATVTGTISYTGSVSCGTDCITSTYDADVTIVFNNFKTMGNYSNVEFVLNGTVTYADYYWSRQSGLSYSSSSSVAFNSSGPLQVQAIIDSGLSGYQDTIQFSASGTDFSLMAGNCTPGNGITYSF